MTYVRFTQRMPSELKKGLGQLAKQKGVSLNALILQILWDWVQRQDDKSAKPKTA